MAGEGNTAAYAAHDASGVLTPFRFQTRDLKDDDVEMKVTHCGMCHSDLHQVKNEWANSIYPMVPGHEVIGVVTKVGAKVTKVKAGDRIGIGCMVGSCRSCGECKADSEQFCGKCVFTYNSKDEDGNVTYGGYSTRIVSNEHFVLRIPDSLPSADAAPLLCAGITVYSPMVYYGLNKPGLKLGVLGLGGLGHMAVKIAKAFGVHVTVLSTSPGKKEEALSVLGADAFVVTKDEEQVKALQASGGFEAILDTVSAKHDLSFYVGLLKVNGKYVIVGAPPEPYALSAFQLIFGRKLVAGSLIGGIKETQEMLDFCAEKNVLPMIEKINIDYVNTAMERILKSDVKYRFVIDVENSLQE